MSAQPLTVASPASELEQTMQLLYGSRVRIESEGRRTLVFAGGEVRRRRFAGLETGGVLRALLPTDDARSAAAAACELRAFRPAARVVRSALRLAGRCGLLRALGSQVEILDDGEEGVLAAVERQLGSRTVFSLVPGTPSRYRKLTVLAFRPELAAVAKLPMTTEATGRVLREGKMLETLAAGTMRNRVPAVLCREYREGVPLLLLSPGPSEPSPTEFGAAHWELLRAMWSLRPALRDAGELLAEVERALSASGVLQLSAARGAATECLARVRALHHVRVACGLSHGDFAPWNLRGRERLFAFDWENAAFERPHLWDLAHFDTQCVTLLGHRSRYRELTERVPWAFEMRLLYLLHSMAEAAFECGAACESVGVRCRLLVGALREGA